MSDEFQREVHYEKARAALSALAGLLMAMPPDRDIECVRAADMADMFLLILGELEQSRP